MTTSIIDSSEIQTKQDHPSKAERMRRLVFSPLDAIAELSRRSLFTFMQDFWDCVCQDELKLNRHINTLCEELEDVAHQVAERRPRDYDLIFNIPPGTTKSLTTTVFWPVWCWTKWPWMSFITASYSSPLSLEHAEKSRDLIRSEKFKAVFPELEIKRDKDAKGNFQIIRHVLENGRRTKELGGTRFSTSVGGTVTGYHGHILIVDDPIDPSAAASEAELKSTNAWMDQTLPTRKKDKEATPIVMIMQRLHEDDPTGHWLAKGKTNVRHVCLPGEIKNFRKQVSPPEFIDKYVDDLLDPVRLGWDALKDLKANLGQYGYSGQIGQKPVPPGGGMFRVERFQIIENMPADVNIVEIVRFWDKAGTQDGGAFTVGAKMARLRNDKAVIMDLERGQWSSEIREAKIKATAEADGVSVLIGIEQEGGSG